MLTFRQGCPGGVLQAAAYVAHLMERTLPEDQRQLADYYARLSQVDTEMNEGMGSVPRPMEGMAPEVAQALGIDPRRAMTPQELGNLLGGLKASGEELPGAQRAVRSYKPQAKAAGEFWDGLEEAATEGKERNRTAWMDLCFSAPKSMSVAWFAAGSEAERQSILQAHRDAVAEVLRYVEKETGWAGWGSGRDSDKPPEKGKMGFVTVDHFTARPTVELVRRDPSTGAVATELYTVRAAGDPQLHTHVIMPNVLVTESGRVMSIDTSRIAGRIHEFGAVYQAIVARNLRDMGVQVELDARTGMAKLSAIPDAVADEFSKRTQNGVKAAAEYASRLNLDWAGLSEDQKAAMLKAAIKEGREGKGDDLANLASWRQQLHAIGQKIGWSYAGTVVEYGPPAPERSDRDRTIDAAWAALPHLEEKLAKSAGVTGADVRATAARGLIAKGMKTTDDVSAVTREMALNGVKQQVRTGRKPESRFTKLLWVGGERSRPEKVKVTTALHRDQELELIALARAASGSKGGGLSAPARDRVLRNSERKLTPEQAGAFHALAGQGMFSVAIGGAGVGKTTLLEPAVTAWKEDGREVWGTAQAWRQANALRDAGIDGFKTWALDPLLDQMEKKPGQFGRQSVVVVDELGQLGTLQLLQLLRFRDQMGFKLVAVGDDRQCQAIAAGPVIDLLREALGSAKIPEVLSTIRQNSEAERELVKLFRTGKLEEAIGIKRADGTAVLAPGGYDEAVKAIAAHWVARTQANAGDVRYTITVTAPTNADALAVGREIREARRGMGQIGPDLASVRATDSTGTHYDLSLAQGDRVRLFARTRGTFVSDTGRNVNANIGDNGSILTVVDVRSDPEKGGLRLRTRDGKEGFVPWKELTDRPTGRIKLTYGDAVTIDTSQGMTSDENILAMPAGSRGVTLFKAHVANSRHRVRSWIIGSFGVELQQVELSRAAGLEPMTPEEKQQQVWENVVKNFSRQPLKESALAILGRMQQASAQARASFQGGMRQRQRREGQGQPASTLRRNLTQDQVAKQVEILAKQMNLNLQVQEKAIAQAPVVDRKRPVRDRQAPLSAPREAQRPKLKVQVSEQEARDQFTEVARSYKLKIDGPLQMDGQRHLVATEDGRRVKKGGGAYKAFYDGGRPNITVWNYKEGVKKTVVATGAFVPMSDAERARIDAAAAASKLASEKAKVLREDSAAQKAVWILEGTRPATIENGYLKRKGFTEVPRGLREDLLGNLVVPLKTPAGEVRNLQVILAVKPREGTDKLYLGGAQKSGTGFLIGRIEEGKPLGIAEGLATAYSVSKATDGAVLMALDTSNLKPLAKAVRAIEPGRELIFFADNDHHLPARTGTRQLPNAGLEKASDAADAVGNAKVVAPPLDQQRHAKDQGTDWNDYHLKHGLPVMKAVVSEGVRVSAPSADPNHTRSPDRVSANTAEPSRHAGSKFKQMPR